MVLKTVCQADNNMSYRQCVDKMVSIANQGDSMYDEQHSFRARRTNSHSKKDYNSDRVVPDVPDRMVKAIHDGTGQQAVGILFKWKNIMNKEHRDIRPDELNVNNYSKDSTPESTKTIPRV